MIEAEWLQQQTVLGVLPGPVLGAIAAQLREQTIPAGQILIQDHQPQRLFILRRGRLEAFRGQRNRLSGNVNLLPGAIVGLLDALLDESMLGRDAGLAQPIARPAPQDRPAPQTVLSLEESVVWVWEVEQFRALSQQYPTLYQVLSQGLAAQLAQVSSQLLVEQERQQVLRPYLVPRVKRGIVGSSRYAQRLRQDIRRATLSLPTEVPTEVLTEISSEIQPKSHPNQRRRPILIFGEPGLEKDNIAALIHFGSDRKQEALIKLDCASLKAIDLVGRVGGKTGLLEWLDSGTVLFNNVQDLDPDLQPLLIDLLRDGCYRALPQGLPQGLPQRLSSESHSEFQPVLNPDLPQTVSNPKPTPPPLRHSSAWILLISERTLPWLNDLQVLSSPALQSPALQSPALQSIKVPPLRVRKADIAAQVDYYVNHICRRTGQAKPRLTPEALRRLQSYDFPGNLAELEGLIQRAIAQMNCGNTLSEELFWPAKPKEKRFRVNLLNAYPSLRRFLRSDWWPDRINFGFTSWFYAVVVAVLFWGPQTRDQNVMLNLFWDWWWPLILLGFPIVGRLWCAVCPFMIYGEIVQKLRVHLWPKPLRTWPRQWGDRWGGWILYGGFALILLWEELWNLENTAYLSGWLLLIITAGAVICSSIFERRFWCRYLCPIGGMNGLFAKLSILELRAQQGICSATCTTYQCYKGGPEKGEGLATGGCPVYSHPAQLVDNRNCVLCMTCLKACPHRSVELNLRPPAIELWTEHQATAAEVALLLLLLGAVVLHRLPQLCQMFWGTSLPLTHFGEHALLAILALFAPGAIALLAYQGAKVFNPLLNNRPFITLAYGYLPLVLAASLAHYLPLGLGEAGRILPVTIATFPGLMAHVPETITAQWLPSLPVITAHPAVVSFLQGTTLIVGFMGAIALTQKIAKLPGWSGLKALLIQHGYSLGITSLIWQLCR